jgi:hypothetical protein
MRGKADQKLTKDKFRNIERLSKTVNMPGITLWRVLKCSFAVNVQPSLPLHVDSTRVSVGKTMQDGKPRKKLPKGWVWADDTRTRDEEDAIESLLALGTQRPTLADPELTEMMNMSLQLLRPIKH